MFFKDRRYLVFISILTFLSITLVYYLITSNIDAKQTLIRAGNRVYSKSGYSFEINTNIAIDDVTQEITFKGTVINPDLVYMEGVMGGFPIEIYRIKDDFFVLNPFNNSWVSSKDIGLDLMGLVQHPGELLSWLNRYSGEVIFGETQNYNGIRCKVVKVYPDEDGIKNLIKDLNSPIEMDDSYLVDYVVKYWVGQRDYLVHRIKTNLVIKFSNNSIHSMEMDTKLHSYTDTPKDIKLPDELKKYLKEELQ